MVRTSIENPSPSDSESVIDLRLPQDLITEILLYLPVKSLVKFKCVSKPWLYLISSPQFIKSHFSTSSREAQHLNQQLLFVNQAPKSGMKHCSLSAALHNPSTNVTHVSDIEYPSRNRKFSLHIVGIINGLVCLDLKDLYLWNPILKQSKCVPGSRYRQSVSNFVHHGFGYDESNDDYKVVKVSCVDRDGVYQSKVKVYSLRSDSWRRIEGFKAGVPFGNGSYGNGKIWWATVRAFGFGSGEKWKIISLDMASDKYEEVQGPCYETGAYYCDIGSFCGSLSMLCVMMNNRRKADLWVMDKNESWSKVFSLPYDDDVHPAAEWYIFEKTVCILGDGEIVLEGNSWLIVYHTKKKEFRKIQLGGLYGEFFVYVESLVPL